MRVVKRFTVLMLVLSILLVMTGCGTKAAVLLVAMILIVKDGYGVDSGGNRIEYMRAKIVGDISKNETEKDTDTTKAYAVSLLVYGDALPLSWNMNTGYVSIGIRMTLNGKDEEFAYSEVSFEAAEGVKPGFKNRVTFVFQIPEDSKLPKQGVLSSAGGSSDPVEINISSAPGWDG